MSFYSELTRSGLNTSARIRKEIKHAEALERAENTRPLSHPTVDTEGQR